MKVHQGAHLHSIARRIAVGGLVFAGLGLALAGPFAPDAAAQSDDFEHETITLEGTHDNVQFLAARSVRISANVADDVFAAGRDVTFDAATVRNAIIAGYDVEQRSGTVADMIAAAVNITIAGNVEDDVVAMARSLRISSSGTVGGDLRLAAETIEMEGAVGGSMRAAARRVTIAGKIVGKADLYAERIVVGSSAVITGDLIYRGDTAPEIAEGATIGGEVRQVAMDMPDLQKLGLAILGIGLLIALAWAIAALLLIVVMQLAFPAFVTDATGRLQAHPWSNLGRGIAILLLAGGLAGLLYASVLGIPLGGAVTTAIAVGSILGLVTVSYCLGLFIRRGFSSAADVRRAGQVGWAVAGAIVLGLVGLIPFVGGIIAGLAIAAGVGAASAELWKRLRAS